MYPSMSHGVPSASVTRLRLENDPASIGRLVQHLQAEMLRLGVLREAHAREFTRAVDEALQNACFHGNLEVDSVLRENGDDSFQRLAEVRRGELPYRDRRIDVTIRVDTECVRVTIVDEGPGFEVDRIPDPTTRNCLEREHGRGLLMMRTYSDEVTFNDRGNEVTLVRWRRRPA